MSRKRISRRSFCGGVAGMAAAAPLGSATELIARKQFTPRKRLPNPFMKAGKPIVVVVKGTNFQKMLAKGIEILGGFRRFGTDNPVVIKPNFVLPIPYPYTTEGESILSVVNALRKDGFSRITVSDWGGGIDPGNEGPTGAFDFYDLQSKAGPKTFRLKDLAGTKTVSVVDKRWTNMKVVRLRKQIYKAPFIINMPVLKRHNSCNFTCGVKNFVGVIDARSRDYMHNGDNLPDPKKYEHTMKAVAEVASAVNPELTIIDARQVVGRHHYDPALGITKTANRLIISGDVIAADMVAETILAKKLNDYSLGDATIMYDHAKMLGLGVAGLDDVIIKKAKA